MAQRLIEIVESLPAVPVALLGDFMVDRYLYGNAERLSPEAPVPVLHYNQEEVRLGGAGSVAANLASLGAKVRCVGVCGGDDGAIILRRLLDELGADHGGLVCDPARPTTCKMRLVGSAQHRHPQQMIRMDYESTAPVGGELEAKLLAALERALDGASVLCIEDYNKGVVTPSLSQKAIALAKARGIEVLVDPPKISDYAPRFRGCTALKLNRPETKAATGLPVEREEHYEPAARKLIETLGLDVAIITLDKDGAYLAERNGGPGRRLTTKPRQVYDVTGAGDVVLATLAVARAAGASWVESVALANVAGGIEVEKFGAVPVKREEIIQELVNDTHEHAGKQRTLEQLLPELARHRATGKKIVFTNGCFDIVHLGHVKYFQFARSQGDLLVVGVNTDSSIRRLKGPKRPVIEEDDRVGVLEELESIDYLVRFDEDTPLELIRAIQPDVLVKGADYRKEQVVGWDVVEARGGSVALAPLIDGRSTSNVIQRILEAYGEKR
jgi:D-beta-D-heptose 7-phosphate kinase/D-beta-D-heptose 1-phosphate adenosyltransferase